MGYYSTTSCPVKPDHSRRRFVGERRDPPSQNRVVGFEGVTFSCTLVTWSQPLETHQETGDTTMWIVSEVGRWLSKDPIGISGGLNQYVAFANNPVCYRDAFGLEPWAEYVLKDEAIYDALTDSLGAYNKGGAGLTEWGTVVLQKPNGKYTYMPPSIGKRREWSPGDVYKDDYCNRTYKRFTKKPNRLQAFFKLQPKAEKWYIEALCHVHPTSKEFSMYDQMGVLQTFAPIYLIHAPSGDRRTMTKETFPDGTDWTYTPGR